MNKHDSSPPEGLPFRLGLYLLEQDCFLCAWPGIRYRGVDRIPADPFASRILEDRNQLRSEADDVWDEWWELRESGALNANLDAAQSLRAKFRRIGLSLDLAYIEVVRIPNNLAKYQVEPIWSRELQIALEYYRRTLPPGIERPSSARFLGYDLSTFHANFHSAIYQPGLDGLLPDLPHLLNEAGLIADLGSASELLEIANSMEYGPLPFCIMGVWEV